MTNETTNDLSKSFNDLLGALGQIGQLQIDLVSSALKSVTAAAEPLGKTATDLVGNITTAATQALQSITSSINPQK